MRSRTPTRKTVDRYKPLKPVEHARRDIRSSSLRSALCIACAGLFFSSTFESPPSTYDKIDYRSPDAPRRVAQSLRTLGFAIVKHHPINLDHIARAGAVWNSFFDGSSEEKYEYRFDPERHSGYVGMDQSETAVGAREKDVKEFFHFHPTCRCPTDVKHETERFFTESASCARTILGWLQDHLPDHTRARMHGTLLQAVEDPQRDTMRALRYPPAAIYGTHQAAEHTDVNLLTLLPAPSVAGLQMKLADGQWHNATTDPLALIIGAGDMLQELTNGYYMAGVHRVVPPEMRRAHPFPFSCMHTIAQSSPSGTRQRAFVTSVFVPSAWPKALSGDVNKA